MSKVRTRYAPSPTGFFHIGGARTALFNYLFAKHNNGDFIVRIEDTDIKRNVVGGIESQFFNLKWLGIKPDESCENPKEFGPYIQSQKLQRYRDLAYKLLSEGKAYRCFCTQDELMQNRINAANKGMTPKYNRHCLFLSKDEIQKKIDDKIPYTIRLKISDNTTISWNDMFRGKIIVPTDCLTDPVILKSNGIAMYNFAVVVDDYDMKITHIIRGEEHISNTPYQIAIRDALGFNDDKVEYGHISLIIGKDGKKLSKRDQTLHQFIQNYRDLGFFPHAVTNFLALLGWSPKTNVEILSMEQLIKDFDVERVSKSPCFFDFDRMKWMSNQYIGKMADMDYLSFIKKFINVDLSKFKNQIDEILLLYKKQISYAKEINDLIHNTFFTYNPQEICRKIVSEQWQKVAQNFISLIDQTKEIDLESTKKIFSQMKKITKTSGKDLFMPIRLLVTGVEHGPELLKIIPILGREEIQERISKYISFLNKSK